MQIQVDLRQAVYALSDALDLVGVNDFYHGKRVGLMAVHLARELGWSQAEQDHLFNTGLLHDCGVSSTAIHLHLVNEFDWQGAQEHCQLGALLLTRFAPLSNMAEQVRHHHTRWQDLASMALPEGLAERANLIFLVDRADALAAPHYGPDLLLYKDQVRAALDAERGSYFSPRLLDHFLDISRADAFWLELEPRHIQGFLGEMLHRSQPRLMGFAELRQIAQLFSYVVDAKSPFTAAHSLGVASLARHLGELIGLDGEVCDQIELAGLMHDLGKLQVPDAILDKAGPLSAAERLVMKRHSFETYQILRRIPGLHEVAAWAAYHHETLDGSGYPYSLRADGLPLPARIIAVADIFQAMAQDRPYRASMPVERIVELLSQRAAEGALDQEVVKVLAARPESCWQAAVRPRP